MSVPRRPLFPDAPPRPATMRPVRFYRTTSVTVDRRRPRRLAAAAPGIVIDKLAIRKDAFRADAFTKQAGTRRRNSPSRSSPADKNHEGLFGNVDETPHPGRSPHFRPFRNNAADNGRAGVAAGWPPEGPWPRSGTRRGGGRRQISPGGHTRGVSLGRATPPGGLQLQSNRLDGV